MNLFTIIFAGFSVLLICISLFFKFSVNLKNDPLRHLLTLQLKNLFATKIIAILLVITLLLSLYLGFFRPILGRENVTGLSTNLNIYYVVDTSLSMNVKDEEGGKARIAKAQEVMLNLNKELSGTKIALIRFTHKVFVEVPLTDDQSTLNLAIETLKTVDDFYAKGSYLSLGLDSAYDMILDAKKVNNNKNIIILISDGEILGEDKGKVDATSKKVLHEGGSIITLGIGSEQGGMIPTSLDNKAEVNYVYDSKTNSKAISKLIKTNLETIADSSNGKYFSSAQISDIVNYIHGLNLQYVESKNDEQQAYKETYQYLAIGTLISFVIYENKLHLSYKKNETFN